MEGRATAARQGPDAVQDADCSAVRRRMGCGDLALLPPLVPVHNRQAHPHPGPAIGAPPQSQAAGHLSGEMRAVVCEGTVNAVRIGNALCYDDTRRWGNNKRGATRAGVYMGCHAFAFRLVVQSVGG